MEFTPQSNGNLSRYLDRATTFMYGGFETLPQFQALLNNGEKVLPFLLTELLREVEDSTQSDAQDLPQSGWWRLQMIWTIAEQTPRPIRYRTESSGCYEEIKMQTVAWGVASGYLGN